MANKNLFTSSIGKLELQTDATNQAGAPAYQLTSEQALIQIAMTGCLNGTFYASDHEQLKTVLELCEKVTPQFIAQVAVYVRAHGYMKDLPALLCAVLSSKAPLLFEKIFDRVIDDGKMLRNFVQIMRSGAVGRKSLGSLPKRMITRWFATRSPEVIFRNSVGATPSLADVIKMTHPKPNSQAHENLYGYLLGKDIATEGLPEIVQEFENYKQKKTYVVPKVPFQMLTALNLGKDEWVAIAKNASWQTTRMNLNTFARHGVYEDNATNLIIAARLRDPHEIAKAKALPYHIMTTFNSIAVEVPGVIREALQDAMEIAVAAVPEVPGRVILCPDVSGSMSSPLTGRRRTATSVVRCIDVAALITAALLRKNRTASVMPFEQQVVTMAINGRDSIMTNAQRLAAIGGGGTNCSAPLHALNSKDEKADLIIFISDNESWMDSGRGRGTELLKQWHIFKQKNPQARMVCIDLQPGSTTQAQEAADILNVGGFSDQVFEVIASFAKGELNSDHFVGLVRAVEI